MSDLVGNWGYYVQGQEQMEKIEMLGSKLNLALNCPVHYMAWNKPLFECKCCVLFPRWMVEYAVENNDWSLILEKHNQKIEIIKENPNDKT